MRFVRNVAIKKNGWKTGPIYSEDGFHWFLPDGTPLTQFDLQADCFAAEFLAIVFGAVIYWIVVYALKYQG